MHLSCMGLGIPGVLKHMLDAGHLHGDCLTVTGKTMAENLESLPSLDAGQTIIAPFSDPVKCTGHIAILSGAAAAMAHSSGCIVVMCAGNLAPEQSVGKITGKEGTFFRGPARWLHCMHSCVQARSYCGQVL